MDSLASGTGALGSMSFGDHGLDGHCLDNILEYVRDAPARGTCKRWAHHIFDSCNLNDKIQLWKLLKEKGSLEFDCFATRELGPDIAETASFHFDFFVDGKFDLQWNRSYSGDWDLPENCPEKMSGKWLIQGNAFACEFAKASEEAPVGSVPGGDPETNKINSTPAGISFQVPHELVLAGRVIYEDDSVLFPWSLSKIILSHGREASDFPSTFVKSDELSLCTPSPEEDPEAQYVYADGKWVAVCTDIVANHPPESWANLMRLRVQFGTV